MVAARKDNYFNDFPAKKKSGLQISFAIVVMVAVTFFCLICILAGCFMGLIEELSA